MRAHASHDSASGVAGPGICETISRVSETREPLRRTFDSAADLYDAARPSYPAELFDDLVELAELKAGDRLLEIGCATGKATRFLLERGLSVVCVEMGAQLAERARHNLAGLPVEIHVVPFEEWEGEQEAFDLVYAATAWHWVDPELRYRKAHRLLRPGGHPRVLERAARVPCRLRSLLQRDPGGLRRNRREPPWRMAAAAAGRDPGRPGRDRSERPLRRHRGQALRLGDVLHTDDYVALLNTFSGHIAMEAAKREHLYREIRQRIGQRPDPRVRRHWYAILYVARRRAQALAPA
jgi:SAM-dependent methyltransferase